MQFIEDFITEGAQVTGGVTGSTCVQHKVTKYLSQLKPSIKKNSLSRQLKAGSTDRENFGEIIAAKISKHLQPEQIVPELSIVYDAKDNQILIASQYISGQKKDPNLDEFAKSKNKVFANNRRHIQFVDNKYKKYKPDNVIDVNTEISPSLKQELANAIVLSAVLGDHDCNPGNLLLVEHNGKQRVAKIDYGHALNDLLNAPKLFGGKILNNNNPVLDFFNRERVAGKIPPGDPSKLWRDYPGMIPSIEIVNALRALPHDYSNKLTDGIMAAWQEFDELFTHLESLKPSKAANESIEHAKKSLAAIYVNISGKPLDLSQSPSELLKHVFSAVHKLVDNNCRDAEKVADIMELQLLVDEALIKGTGLTDRAHELISATKKEKIEWIKTGTSPAFVGNFEEYLVNRSLDLEKDYPATVASNYSALREQYLTKTNLQVTTKYKNQVSEIKARDGFDTEYLAENVEMHSKILIYGAEGEDRAVSQNTINAINALVNALHGIEVEGFPEAYADTLLKGQVANIISMSIPDNIIPSGPPAQRVQVLLEEMKNNSIPVIIRSKEEDIRSKEEDPEIEQASPPSISRTL